jgi:pimeloyl-ACP methyl ester carboxylesterase
LEVNKPNVFGYSMGSVLAQITVLEYPQMVNKVVWHATGISGNDVNLSFASDPADIPVTVQKQMNANLSWSAPLEKYLEIKNDIMLLIGTDDTVVGLDSSLELATLVPGAWLIQMKGCTHSLHHEKPVVAAEMVLDFLKYNLSYSK